METISQMATTAAKYAFGDSTSQEPISGSQGDVSKGEPYDAGNLDSSEQERIGQSLGGSTESSSHNAGAGAASKSENTGRITTATNVTDDAGFTHPQHDMSAPGLRGSGSGGGGITTSTNRTTDSGFTTPGQDMGGGNPGSLSSSSSNNNRTTSSNQDLDRIGTENVDSKSKPSEKPSSTQDDNEGDVDVSGPGPRDVSDVARENGGDAGRHGAAETSAPPSSSTSPDTTKQKQPGDVPADASQDKGTGELYVRSSGLQADGGDFDATKPGAGREADRLMEQKGITGTSSSSAAKDNDKGKEQHHKSGSGGSEGKEKHGLVEKIKEKLHKH